MHHVWLAIKIAHCTRAKVVCAVLKLLWLSLHFLFCYMRVFREEMLYSKHR